MEIFTSLASEQNATIAILSSLVTILSGVVVFQWNYTAKSTVPKWIWDTMVSKLDAILELQQKITLVLDEGLKK